MRLEPNKRVRYELHVNTKKLTCKYSFAPGIHED